jgi:hypothetical protein
MLTYAQASALGELLRDDVRALLDRLILHPDGGEVTRQLQVRQHIRQHTSAYVSIRWR